jgi:hypothetical protein
LSSMLGKIEIKRQTGKYYLASCCGQMKKLLS